LKRRRHAPAGRSFPLPGATGRGRDRRLFQIKRHDNPNPIRQIPTWFTDLDTVEVAERLSTDDIADGRWLLIDWVAVRHGFIAWTESNDLLRAVEEEFDALRLAHQFEGSKIHPEVAGLLDRYKGRGRSRRRAG